MQYCVPDDETARVARRESGHARQHGPQRHPRGGPRARHVFRGAGGRHATAAHPALRPQGDDPVGLGDDVEVVLFTAQRNNAPNVPVRALAAAAFLAACSATAGSAPAHDRPPRRDFTDATPALNSPSYRTTGGYPVKAYVIDSGIQPHADLNFNWQVDHISFDAHANVDGVCNPDSNGVCQTTPTYSYLSTCESHATHVAGIIGAIRQTGTPAGVEGVAPGASVVSVRVINYCQHRIEDQTGPNPKPSWEFPGLTYLSTVLSAIDWVKAKSAAAGGSSLRTGAVANMRILWDQGALTSTARTGLQTAITQAVNAGVFFAFAGGNGNQSACDLWPAKLGSSIAGAMTVGAMNNSGLPMHGIPGEPGKIASYGPCVEIWAPGQSVQSTGAYAGTVRGITYPVAPGAWWPGMPSNPSSTNVGAGQDYCYPISGSSMAAPHVAGAALLVLKKSQQAGQPLPSPAALEACINTPARLKAMGNYGGNPAPPAARHGGCPRVSLAKVGSVEHGVSPSQIVDTLQVTPAKAGIHEPPGPAGMDPRLRGDDPGASAFTPAPAPA